MMIPSCRVHVPIARALGGGLLRLTGATARRGSPAAQESRSVSTLAQLKGEAFDPRGRHSPAKALDKSGVATRDELFRSPERFDAALARTNTLLALEPGVLATRCLDSRDILDVALGFIQAARHHSVPLDTPEAASLIYQLLRSLPLDETLRGAFRDHARSMVAAGPVTSLLRQEPATWWTLDRHARRLAVEATRDGMPALYSGARQAAGASIGRMPVEFDSELPACSAMYMPSDGGGRGEIRLSAALLGATAPDHGRLALSLVSFLMTHELWHAEQYASLELLEVPGVHHYRDLEQAIRYALSLSLQETLRKLERLGDIDASSSDVLCPHLPHEFEAWAAATLAICAALRDPQLPGATKAVLREYLVNTFDRFSRLVGVDCVPRPRDASGELWTPQGALALEARTLGKDEVQGQVDALIAQAST